MTLNFINLTRVVLSLFIIICKITPPYGLTGSHTPINPRCYDIRCSPASIRSVANKNSTYVIGQSHVVVGTGHLHCPRVQCLTNFWTFLNPNYVHCKQYLSPALLT